MVVVKLMGGLGNQMFQYACGRRLAAARSAELKLDISDLGGGSGRAYALCHLDVSADIASEADIGRFKTAGPIWKALYRARIARRRYRERNVIRERFFHFDEQILSLTDNVYLEGYWQSERYFADVEAVIRREFTCKEPADAENARLAEQIRSTNSVSLHVRRGDYVSDPKTSRVHGVCTMDYYGRAVRRIADAAGRLHLYVFSDDPVWVRSNLRLDHETTYLDRNPADRGHEDLRLMSLCRHHVIANSSFSWWGAWLARDTAKMVVAPSKWFNDYSADTRDLLPRPWIRL
jgi:glycosyl transferase family 11